jgi:hypothetical protein
MLDFVKRWLFSYGEPKRPVKKPSAFTRWKEHLQEAKVVLKEFFFSHAYSALSSSERKQRAEEGMQGKIFEILRIRNRLDPRLKDTTGGYRDLALKLKIGFFR